MRRRLGVLATLFLVVVAGCNAPVDSESDPTAVHGTESRALDGSAPTAVTTVPATQEPRRAAGNGTQTAITPTPRPADVAVSGDLPVDAGKTFGRVRQLLDARADPPAVKVYSATSTGGTFGDVQNDDFEAVLGIGPPQPVEDSELQTSGMTFPTGRVFLAPRAGRAPAIERTLAHEFTHSIQFAQGDRAAIRAGLADDRLSTSDGTLTARSLLEGAAVYTASEYVRRYQPRYPTERTQISRLYANATGGTRLYWAAYHHGADYVSSRVDAPADLGRVYRTPPSTTEQLLHGTRDSPVPLGVSVPDGDSRWTVSQRDSRGELFVRVVLGTEVPRARAAAAAAGWGNDRVLTFRGGSEPSFAWITRWDDAANATEFATVASQFLDERTAPASRSATTNRVTFRMERLDDRTVVLLAGSDRFVSETSVQTEPSSVVVRPPRRR
ncbi:hypothetical protein ACFR9U_11335 [Halorientalis brevis]|uniref:DUF4157 domain-containing protein n=1 Tax=Halorientalis brevis TaxID=1126241 RepID=A0ABD6CBF5_9EURY|nr:hypothetical protein [Halorientalis brevis]